MDRNSAEANVLDAPAVLTTSTPRMDGTTNGTHREVGEQLSIWNRYLGELFGIELDPKRLKIPARQAGLDLLVVEPKVGLGIMLSACRVVFGPDNVTSFAPVEKIDRYVKNYKGREDPEEFSAFWMKDHAQPGIEIGKDPFAGKLWPSKLPCINLEGHLMYWLMRRLRERDVWPGIDTEVDTYCCGSVVSANGRVLGVPSVSGCDGRLTISFCENPCSHERTVMGREVKRV